MKVLGLDPGSSASALVVWDADRLRVRQKWKLPNADLARLLVSFEIEDAIGRDADTTLVIESTSAYTVPGGRQGRFMPQQLLETVEWSGYFRRCWHQVGGTVERLDRRKVKLHLLGRASGTDAHVRAALLELVGPQGTKKAPGPTFGMRADLWAALAVAYVWQDQAARAAQRETISSGDDRPEGPAVDRPL